MKKNLLIISILFVSFYTNPTIAQTDDSNFKLGFIERIRLETWDNVVTLDNSQLGKTNYLRSRTSLWTNWKPFSNLEFYAKITNEFRYYFKPETKFNINEFFFDNLYLKYSPTNAVALTLGRQNIMLGEGFVVMDGHPLDGSRSIYFNAFRADFKMGENDNATLFYTYQPVKDNILPVINDREQALIEQPETGIGMYYSGKFKHAGFDAYIIRKLINSTEQDTIASRFNTVGFRLNYLIYNEYSVTAEAAYQIGNIGDNIRKGIGGYTYIDYKPSWGLPFLHKASAGLIYLSGDDPATANNEGWDPLFSRWPKWSESYIYTQILEYGGKVAYWSNFISIFGSVELDVIENINLDIDFHHMLSQYPMSNLSVLPSGGGTTRGELLIVKLNYKLLEQLTGHFLLEKFWPGNFYSPGADGYYWFRIEAMYLL